MTEVGVPPGVHSYTCIPVPKEHSCSFSFLAKKNMPCIKRYLSQLHIQFLNLVSLAQILFFLEVIGNILGYPILCKNLIIPSFHLCLYLYKPNFDNFFT